MEVGLVVQSGPMKGQQIVIPTGEILVGRKKGCKIRLGDPRVSRNHCRLAFDGTRLEVEDLDSANGTWVNGERVRRSVLKPGDSLAIGGVRFAVVVPGQEVQDETVAVMGRPAGRAPVSEVESIAGAMAAMVEAEADTGGDRDTIPISVAPELGAPAAKKPPPADEEAPIELVEEEPKSADEDEGLLKIDWEPPSEEGAGRSGKK